MLFLKKRKSKGSDDNLIRQEIKFKDGTTMTYTYDDERFIKYINGRRCETDDDLTEWSVLYGFYYGLWGTLYSIEITLDEGACLNCAELRNKWQLYYERYRAVCLQCGFWNRVIGDYEPFVGN